MRGKLKELWHRHVGRKPWIFRDDLDLAYLCAPEDEVAGICERGTVINNSSLQAWMNATVQAGQTFVDLSPGAGGVSMLAARLVGLQGAVFTFTGDSKCYRQLVNNAALNGLTGTWRIIGRSVLDTAGTAVSVTLDAFARDWALAQVDYVRLHGAALLPALERSASQLLRTGRIRHIVLDGVEAGGGEEARARLGRLGFMTGVIDAAGKLQSGAGDSHRSVSIVGSRSESSHG